MYYMANWSMLKMTILIGSLSSPNFAIRTTKMDRSRIHFAEFLYQTLKKRKLFCLADNFG